MLRYRSLAVSLLLAGASMSSTVVARADPAPSKLEPSPGEMSPDLGLVGSGVVVFGASYAASFTVAATSTNPGDKHLYAPVAGPWIDLAKRPACPPGRAECGGEPTSTMLLVGDGVLQALGVLQVIAGLASSEPKPGTVRVAPNVGLRSVGVSAAGVF